MYHSVPGTYLVAKYHTALAMLLRVCQVTIRTFLHWCKLGQSSCTKYAGTTMKLDAREMTCTKEMSTYVVFALSMIASEKRCVLA